MKFSLPWAMRWSFVGLFVRYGLGIVGAAILARLFRPNDFGLLAMVATFTSFLAYFIDMGFSWVAVQKEDLSKHHLSNLLWLNMAVGTLLMGACFLGAEPLARFYGEPLLADILRYQSPLFLLSCLNVVPIGLLRRENDQRAIALRESLSYFFSLSVTLVWCQFDESIWPLALMPLLTASFQFLSYLNRIPWSWPRQVSGAWDFLDFGGFLSLGSLCVYFSRHLDDILVGRFWRAEELAYYTKAYFIIMMVQKIPGSAVAHALIPKLSRLTGQKEEFFKTFEDNLFRFSLVVFPACFGIAAVADEVIHLMYGSQWGAAVPLLRFLAWGGAFQVMYNSVGWVLIAQGRGRAYFYWSLVSALILGLAFYLSVGHGVETLALCYSLVMIVALSLPSLHWVYRKNQRPFLPLLKRWFPILITSLIIMGLVEHLGHYLQDYSLLVRTLVKVLTGIAAYYLIGEKILRLPLKQTLKVFGGR